MLGSQPVTITAPAVGVTVNGKNAGGGANLYVEPGSTATVTRMTFADDGSNGVGAGIQNDGTLTLDFDTITGNVEFYQYGSGGGIHNTGTLVVTNSTISNNQAGFDADGGGIENERGRK